MEEVKEFIEMMEGLERDAKYFRDKQGGELQWRSNWSCQHKALMNVIDSPEYQALKALLDKPISKMEITDDMVKEACRVLYGFAWRKDMEKLVQNALKAVFASMPVSERDKYKEAQKAENKRQTKIMEQIALNPKPAIFAEQTTDAQCNDGWSIWFGGDKPPVSNKASVEVRYRNRPDDNCVGAVNGFYWGWDEDDSDIIAYRIIYEPKEEKKETAAEFCKGLYEGATGKRLSEKEPKKQTLPEQKRRAAELTKLEHKILNYIEEYIESHEGRSPLLRQIGDNCGINSLGTIHRYIDAIIAKGFMEKGAAGFIIIETPVFGSAGVKKKQTLLEYALSVSRNLNMLSPEELIGCMSEYLELNK